MDLEHAVADRGTYRASVLSSDDLGPATLSFACGSEVIYPALLTPKATAEEGFTSEYALPTGDTWQPFKLAYGFVAPGVSVSVQAKVREASRLAAFPARAASPTSRSTSSACSMPFSAQIWRPR